MLKHRLLVISACGSLLALADPPTGMFRGNPQHTGVYEGPAPALKDAPKWKLATGGPILSSPVVAAGTVFIGSGDRRLYAVSAADGTLKWKFDAKGAVNSSPAVAGDLVYFSSRAGAVYAVDTATGQQRWKFETPGEHRFTAPGLHGLYPAGETMPDPWDTFLSSPAVVDGTVYVGSGNGNLYALSAATGEQKWKFATGDVVHSSPAIAGGRVYFGSFDSYFYALDAATGKLVWKFKTGEDPKIHNQVGIQSSPAVVDGTVYFGCRDSFVYALDAGSGELKWKFNNKGSWVNATPAVYNGMVFFTTSDSVKFHAVNAKTGEAVFDLPLGIYSFSSPAIVAGRAYFGTHAGVVRAVDLKTQQYAGTFETEGHKQNWSKYTNAEGKVDPAALFAKLDMTLDGTVIYISRLFSAGSVLSSPVISDGVLYVGSADGNLYAVE